MRRSLSATWSAPTATECEPHDVAEGDHLERYRIRWTGPQPSADGEQVANARDDFVDLTPVSQARAEATSTNWSALLPGQEIPLIWERNHGREED